MRKINEIIIHCSDTPDGRPDTADDIKRWHIEGRGFRTIGYHYVVHLDGEVVECRPIKEIGAHCLGHNLHSIGICYIGGRSADMDEYMDTRTKEQKKSLEDLITYLLKKFPHATIHGHRDFANRFCPCFDAEEEYKHLIPINHDKEN